MKFPIQTLIAAILLAIPTTASAQYPGWQHDASFFILTTPEGANLPATATAEGFPLLVRLDKDSFDFKQAQATGADLRFAAAGKPLAYQIDQWDAAAGTAAIWVRIPTIKGNARQELKMFWGKADAKGESSGKAVFNESNGYLSVWHMGEPVTDDVGTTVAKDTGTAAAAGMIGMSRHFEQGKGINCGANIAAYPTGSSPHSTEAWFRAQQTNAPIMAWGNDAPQGKLILQIASPPHIKVECWFSGADVQGQGKLPLSHWIHVVHTYQNGDSRIYVNGTLDGTSTSTASPLAIKSPARMYIGGWYDNYKFVGEIDEARLSKVTRSADWVKLQYENQKPLQTVVGPLVRPGSDFALSAKTISLLEGKSITVTAKAGGAQKLYWIIKRGTQEAVAAADRFSFTLDAGRVTGDDSFTLQLKAVLATQVKTLEIPVSIKEDIADPVYTLQAPATWNGRDPIEVVPQITNLPALQAKGAATVKTQWSVSGLAVIKEEAPGKLILKRSQNSGKLTVTATAANGGKPVIQTIQIMVKEPEKEAWVQRTPDKDEKPVDNQFYARDDNNEGTLYYSGTLTDSADSVFLKLYAGDKLVKSDSQKPKADKSYAFAIKLKAALVIYKVEFGTKTGSAEKIQQTVSNLVCGDAYIIDGQSNAVGYNYENTDKRQDLTRTNSPWIRSFGGNGEAADPLTGGWGNAVVERLTPTSPDRVHFISVWGMALAKKLVEDTKIPICILNGAVGGTRIDEHMPDDVKTANKQRPIYSNLKQRVIAAKLTHGIRGVLWHQGEADQGSDGPDNCYGCEMYENYWLELTAAWKQDYPNIRHYYLFQIWPNACSQGGTRNSDKLRDVQRRLSRLYSSLSVVPTLDIPSGANCHFKTDDYEKMGLAMAPLLERDIHGKAFPQAISAADLIKASYTTANNDGITLEFDQPVAWLDALSSQFYLDGEPGKVTSGSVSGNLLKLKLTAPATAKSITYLTDKRWDPKTLLYGKNGLAALTFCEVPIGINAR
ncbi:MAG: DUF2341 domain-containing protein [Verrucomicrobia bacterium]|nr:DUF2341 domain-containing protein [Verrucomicrobiota bacterium]